jgi:integrase
MILTEYAERYLSERVGLSHGYCRLMRATVKQLCAWAEQPLQLAEVDRPLLSEWARCLLVRSRPSTVNGKLRMVRSLLLAAYDDGVLDRPPKRNKRLRENLPSPQAWSLDEVRRLLEFLGRLRGHVGGVPASDWWVSLCLTLYWSGARISAVLACEVPDYDGLGLLVRKQKNGRAKFYALPQSCCEAIDRILPSGGRIWEWPLHSRTLWLRFRRYIVAAGLPVPGRHTDLFHKLRRTNLSYCAAVDPALAQRQADHASLETTRRHYLDPRIATQVSAADVLPDPLGAPRLRVFG